MSKLLIRGGIVVDGSGTAGVKADVAVDDAVISDIAPEIDSRGREVLDAEGLIVAPGFIDIHSHTDATIFMNPFAESKLFQGVTTEVVGNCGIGCFPVKAERTAELEGYLKMHGFSFPPEGISWLALTDYGAAIEKAGIGLNIAPLVSHGTLRLAVMGSENRQPSVAELAEMKDLLQDSLAQGAWGLSVGLIYPPGSYAKTDELIELGKVVAQYGALFSSHVRGESATLLEAIDEMIEIGEVSKAHIEVSHLKALGRPYWGKGKVALERIEAARKRGVAIGADQYPYEASNTALSVLVPQWAHDGGVEKLLQRLGAPEYQEQLTKEIEEIIQIRGGAKRIMIAGVGSKRNQSCMGKWLQGIADGWQCSPAQAVIRLLREEEAIVSGIYFSISEDDLEYILANSQVAVGSDGRGMQLERSQLEAAHPRSYGTFSRVLSTFVREKKLISLEKAIYKMTGLPATRLGFKKRGFIRKGYAADFVVFDPAAIQDQADFSDPHRYATGNRYVVVNGQVVVVENQLTGKRPGRVLRKL